MDDPEYIKMQTELQKYLPFLENMIAKLQNAEKMQGKSRLAQLAKMQSLYGILTNKKKKMKIETLHKCEEVLKNLHEKVDVPDCPTKPVTMQKPPKPSMDESNETPLKTILSTLKLNTSLAPGSLSSSPTDNIKTENTPVEIPVQDKPLKSYDDLSLLQKYNDRNRSPPPELVPEKVLVSMLRGSVTRLEIDEKDIKRDSRPRSSAESTISNRSRDRYKSEKSSRRRSPYRKQSKSRTPNRDSSGGIYKRRSRSRERETLYRRRSRSPPRSRNRINTSRNVYSKRRIPSPKSSYELKKHPSSIGKDNADNPVNPSVKENKKENVISLNAHTKKETSSLTVFDRLGVKVKSPVRTVNDNDFKVSTAVSKSVIPNLNSPPLTMDDIEKLLAENKDNPDTSKTQAATVHKDKSVYSTDNLVAKDDMNIQELKKVRDQIRDQLKQCVPSPKGVTSNEPKTPPPKVITIRKIEEVSIFGNTLSSIDSKILEVNNKINKKDFDKEKSHKSKKESETEDSKVRKDKNQKVNVSHDKNQKVNVTHDKSKSGSSTDSSSNSSSTCHSSDKSSCDISKVDKLTNTKQTKDIKTMQIDKNIVKVTTLIESKHFNETASIETNKDIKKGDAAVMLTQPKDHRTTQSENLVGKAVYEHHKDCSNNVQDKNCSNNDNTTNTSLNLDSNKEKVTIKNIVSNPVQSRRLSDKYPRKKVTEMKDNINAQTTRKIADLEVTPQENVVNASLDIIDSPRGKAFSNIPDVKQNDPRKKHSSPSFKDCNTNPNTGNIPPIQFSNEICNFPNSINEFQFPANKDTDMRLNNNINMGATTSKFSAPRRPLLPNPIRPLINSPIHQIPSLLGPYPSTIHQPVMYTNNHLNRLSNPDLFERNRNNERRGGFARRGRGKFRSPRTRFQTYGEVNNMIRSPEYHRQHPQNFPDATNVPSSTLSPKPNNPAITLPAKVSERDPRRSIDRDPRNRQTNTIIQTPSEDFSIKSVYKEPIASGKSFQNYKIPRLKREDSTDARQEGLLTPDKLIEDSIIEEDICNKELSSTVVLNSEECSTVEDIPNGESFVDTVADNVSNIKSKVSETEEQDEHTINNIQSVSESQLPEKNVLQLEVEDNNVLPENEASDTQLRETMIEKSEIQNIVKEEQAPPDSTNEECNEVRKNNKCRKIPSDSTDDDSDDSRSALRSMLNQVVEQYTKKKKKKNKNKISKLKKLLGPKKFQKFLERIFEFDSESEENSSESDNNSDHETVVKEEEEILSPVVKQRTRKRIAALKSSSDEDESDNNQELTTNKATRKLSELVDESSVHSVQSEVHEKRPKRRNALEMLQLDVRDMFISDDVVHANGRRQCRTYGDDKIETDIELKTPPRTRKTRPKSILANSLENNETDDEENSEIQPSGKRFPLIVLEKLAGDKDTISPQKNTAIRGRGVARRGRKNFRRVSNRNFDEQNKFEAAEDSEIENGRGKDINTTRMKSPEPEPESVQSSARVLRGSVNKSISIDEPNTSIDNEDELQESLAEAEEVTDVNNASSNGCNIKQRKKIKRKNSWRLGILTKGKKIRKKSNDAVLTNLQMNRILNNDLTYCFNGPEKYRCKLCTFNGKSIGAHYAVVHPESEVHISRLNAEEAVLALNEKDTETDVPTSLLMTMFNYICRFCNDSFINCSPMSFYEHIVTHTGELRVACSDCNYKAVKPESIKSHSKTAHGVSSTLNLKILYDLPEELHPIYGYICTECNFTQYLEDNVIKHIKGTHRNIMIKIAKIRLYRIEIDSPGISKKRKTVEETSLDSAQTETEPEGDLAILKLCSTSQSKQQSPELKKVSPDENINIKKESVILDTNGEVERNNSDSQKESTSVIEQPKKIVSEFTFDNMLPLKMSITERLKQKIDMLAEEERRKAAAAAIAICIDKTLSVASEDCQVTKDNTTSSTSISSAPSTTIIRSETMEICNPEPTSLETVENISTRDVQVDEQSEGGDNDCDWTEDMESNDSYSALDSNKALEHVDEVLKMVDEQKRANVSNIMVNNTIQRLAASLKTKPQISQILDKNTSNLLNNEISESSAEPPSLVGIVIKQKQDTGIVVGMVSAEVEPNHVRLSCLVQGCIFQCVSRAVLTNHFEMCHPLQKWDGFCNICKRQLVLPSPGPNFRLHCVDHLFMYHIKNKSKDVASTPAKGLIKLRRLSGDILSVVKAENEFPEDTNDDLPPVHLEENTKISDNGQIVTITSGNIGSVFVKKTSNPTISSTSILMNELNRLNTSPVSSLLNDIKALPNKNVSAVKSETSAGSSGQQLQTPKNSVDTSFTSNKILFSANKFVGKQHVVPIFLKKNSSSVAASVNNINHSSTTVVTPSINSIVSLPSENVVSNTAHKTKLRSILPKDGLLENDDVTNLTSSNKDSIVTSCIALPDYNFSTSVGNAGLVNLFTASDSVDEPLPSLNYLVFKPVPESTTTHETIPSIVSTVSLAPVDVIAQTDTDTIGINDENSSKSVNTDSVSMDPLDIDDPLAIDPLAEENEVSSDVFNSNMIQIQNVWSMAETIPREDNGLSSEVESVSKQSKQTEETKNTITTSENKTCKSASFSKSPETKRHLINLDVSTDNILPQHVRRGGVSRAASSPLSKKSPSKSPSTSNIKKTPEKHMNRLPLPPRPKPPLNLNISGIAGDEIMEVVELEDDDYEITEETRPVPQFVISDCKPKPWIPCKSIIKKTFSTYTLTKLTHLYKCMSHSCSYSTQIKTNFIEHIKSHALWNNEHDKNAFKDYYECAYCSLNFESSGGLALHIDDYHSHCQYQCRYCFYRAESRVYIMKHMDNFHKTRPAKILVIPVSDDVKAKNITLFESKDYTMKTMIPYKCSVPRCSFFTPLTKEFRSHLRKHRIEKVKCNECEEILSKPKDLIVHAQKHNKYFYHCIYCPYGDEIRDNLAGHLMVTHPEYPARVALRTPETLTNNQVKCVSLELSGTPRHMELLDTDLDHTGVEEKIEYEGPPPKNDTDTTPLISFDNRINETNDSDSDNDNLIIDEGPRNDEEDPDWRPSQESRTRLSHIAKKNEPVNGDSFLSCTSSLNLNVNNGVEVIRLINDAEDVTESEDPLSGINEKIPLRSNEMESETSLTSTLDITNESLNSTKEKFPDEDDVEHLNKETATFNDSTLNGTKFSNNEGLEDNLVQVTLETIKETGKSGSELFICCYCDYCSESSSELKAHCNECTEKTNDPLQCPHCARFFKWVAPYVEHIKVHGTHRYGCSLCNFRGPVQANVRKHLKQAHKVSFIEIIPADPTKSNVDLDLFIVRPKLDMSKAVLKYSSLKTSKNKYGPTEIDKLPIKSIYNDDVYCVLCAFKTKVRSNMVRHLQQHAAEKLVSAIAPVNPVPCLVTNEKHFDKMTNLAISSHEDGRAGLKTTKNIDSLTLEEEKAIPMYISAGKRFVCGISNCKYLTVNAEMLKHHYKALHSDDTDYSCPHCPNKGEQILKGPICIDDILAHLRNHEAKLYRCPHCVYYKNHKYLIETHLKDNHSDLAGTVMILREVEEDNTLTDEKSLKVKKQKNWKCDLCTTKTVDQSEITQHVLENHGLRFQYQCGLCMFRCSETIHFSEHFSVRHVDQPIQYVSMYSKVIPEGDIKKLSTSGSDLDDTTPLWSRENNGCRYIRGILVDEENDKITTSNTTKGIVKVALNDSTKGSTSEKSRWIDGFVWPSKLRKRKHKSYTTATATIDTEETGEILNTESKGTKRRRTIDSVKTKIQLNNSEMNDVSLLDDKNQFMLPDSSMDFGPIIDFTLEDDVIDISTIGDLDDTDSPSMDTDIPSSYINITNDIPQMMSALNNDFVDSNDAGVVVEGFFGPYGEPKDGKFVCPLCVKFTTASSAEMENHLFIELQYMRWQCCTCFHKSHDKVELIDSCQFRHPQSYNIENITQLPVDNKIVECISKLLKTQSALLFPQVSLLQNESLDKEPNQELSAPVINQVEFVDSDDILSKINLDLEIKKDVVSRKRKLQSKNTQITEDIQKPKLETPSSTSSKKLNKCKFCKYTSKTTQDLRRHELRHLKERPYTCGYCSFGNIEERVVKKHCETKHIGREIKININIPQDESKADIKPVLKTSQRSAASEEENQSTLTEDTVYVCQYCPKSAKQLRDLQQHWAAVHKNDKVCSNGKIRKGAVFQYRVRSNKEVSKKSGGKNQASVFKCQHCGKLATLKTMKHHQKQSHPLLPEEYGQVSVASYVFSCKLCTYVVSVERTMQNHYAENHKENPVDYLLKVTGDEDEPTLKNASKNNSNCKFKCEYCVEISETQAMIKEHHERLHSHKALVINRVYDTPALSTSKNKYRCATCNYQTNYFNSINDHIMVHLKPYFCFYCNQSFSKSIDVEHHCKYTHPDKVFYEIHSEKHSDQLLNELRNGINVQMSDEIVKLFEDLTKEEKANLVQDYLIPKSNVREKEPLTRKTAASSPLRCAPSKIMRHKDDLDISTSNEALYLLNESSTINNSTSLNLEQEQLANNSKET